MLYTSATRWLLNKPPPPPKKGKGLKTHFTKKEIQMAPKYMKRYSNSLIREIEIKTTQDKKII